MSASTPRLLFDASRKIKRSRDFATLKSQGSRMAVGCLVGNWRVGQSRTPARAGIITSSRIGCAVIRNRARRHLREAFRLHQQELPDSLEIILIARPSIAGKHFTDVERDFLTLARRAGLLKRDAATETK